MTCASAWQLALELAKPLGEGGVLRREAESMD